MEGQASRLRRRRRTASANAPSFVDQPSTSSVLTEDENSLVPSTCSMLNEQSPQQEQSECVTRRRKRRRAHVDDKLEESSAESRTDRAPFIPEKSHTEEHSSNEKRRRINNDTEESSAEIRTDVEQIAIESQGPSPTRSQEDVMIVGDVQVARPEVIDLERLPTIRRGGSLVVDLTNDGSFHDNNVVDLTRENPTDSSIDSSPVIVYVNRIYHRDPIHQLPSCRFESLPRMLDSAFNAITSGTDDEIEEVADVNAGGTQNSSLNASVSSTEDPDAEGTQKDKITCPICMDDDQTIKRRKRQLTSTTCGHVFCDKCIRSAVQLQNKCPTCRKKLSMRQLHPIFL